VSFFSKKRRFSEVEGYERISRGIEERQRELGGEGGADDDLADDTVLLAPSARAAEPVVESVTPIRPSEVRAAAAPTVGPAPTAPPAAGEWSPPAPTGTGAAPLTPDAAAPARMPVPDLLSVGGGATLVARDAVWDGKLTASGDVRVEGTIQGEIEAGGTLFVAAQARVQAVVRAKNVVLGGEIEGRVFCEGRLEILPGGSARGEIDTGALVVHEGAFIDSKFQMHGAPAPARA
jgi:cytoskeletal protein CcmA (bactofilin family)